MARETATRTRISAESSRIPSGSGRMTLAENTPTSGVRSVVNAAVDGGSLRREANQQR
jgi:hypothetical protein